MLKKTYSKSGQVCRATFKLPADVSAQNAALLGEFNEWNPATHPMKKLKDGSFSITISLKPDQTYRFRYLLDGKKWENDWSADAYIPNEFGTEDSLIEA